MHAVLVKPLWRSVSFTENTFDQWHLNQFARDPAFAGLVDELILDDRAPLRIPSLRDFCNACAPSALSIHVQESPVISLLHLNPARLDTLRLFHDEECDLSHTWTSGSGLFQICVEEHLRDRYATLRNVELSYACYEQERPDEFQGFVDGFLHLVKRPYALNLFGISCVSLASRRHDLAGSLRVLRVDVPLTSDIIDTIADLHVHTLSITVDEAMLMAVRPLWEVAASLQHASYLPALKHLELVAAIPGGASELRDRNLDSVKSIQQYCQQRDVEMAVLDRAV